MSRRAAIACLVACGVWGCGSTKQLAVGQSEAVPQAAPAETPRWVKYGWLEDHPVAMAVTYYGMVTGVVAGGCLAGVASRGYGPGGDLVAKIISPHGRNSDSPPAQGTPTSSPDTSPGPTPAGTAAPEAP
jgi:outer membrane lipoprotein SlyB